MRILYILLALVILMILITVHEFGHYIAGKIFKFKINEFSIGFGPAIYKKTKKNGEIFSIRALPLGGYCAFAGEDEQTEDNSGQNEQNSDIEKQNDTESEPKDDTKNQEDQKTVNLSSSSTESTTESQEKAKSNNNQIVVSKYDKKFNDQPAWKRLIVLFGGVLFNFLFGIITSAIYLMVAGYGVPVVAASRQTAILQGDKIVAVNGVTVEAYRPMSDILSEFSGENTVILTVVRGGETIKIDVTKQDITNGYYYVSNEVKATENVYVLDGTEYTKIVLEDFHQDVINAPLVFDSETEKYYPILSNIYYKKTGENTFEEYTAKTLVSDGVLGYASAGKSLGIMYYTAVEHYGFFECLIKAWPFGFYICKVILGALGGLFTGATKISDLGGTITTISTIATYSAMNPLIILYLFPMLSFNLAIFNILPIPALDGARMVFVLWELITKKPVNRKVEGYIHTIGLFVLLALVIFLDVYHLFV